MENDKVCFKCGVTKPKAEFYTHKRMADGLLGKCKACTRVDVRSNRDDKVDLVRAYDRARGNRQPPGYLKAWRRANPEKLSAHNAVARALRSGVLVRLPCEACGSLSVHAHHDDYSKKLDVRWLCTKHHRQHHCDRGID